MTPRGITFSGPVKAVPFGGATVVGSTVSESPGGGVIVVGATLVLELGGGVDVLGGVVDVLGGVLAEVLDVVLDVVVSVVLDVVVSVVLDVVVSVVVVGSVVVCVVVLGGVVVVSPSRQCESCRCAPSASVPVQLTVTTVLSVIGPVESAVKWFPWGDIGILSPPTLRVAPVTLSVLGSGLKFQCPPLGQSRLSDPCLLSSTPQVWTPSANAGLGKIAQASMRRVPAVTTMRPAVEKRLPSVRARDPSIRQPPLDPLAGQRGTPVSDVEDCMEGHRRTTSAEGPRLALGLSN
jgi:hypothetical protein